MPPHMSARKRSFPCIAPYTGLRRAKTMRDLAMGGYFSPACWLSALSPCSRRCCCNRLFSPSGAWAACPAARCGGFPSISHSFSCSCRRLTRWVCRMTVYLTLLGRYALTLERRCRRRATGFHSLETGGANALDPRWSGTGRRGADRSRCLGTGGQRGGKRQPVGQSGRCAPIPSIRAG